MSTTQRSTKKRKVIPLEEWFRKVSEAPVSRRDLNKVIMNFLVVEGYKDVAIHFANESIVHLRTANKPAVIPTIHTLKCLTETKLVVCGRKSWSENVAPNMLNRWYKTGGFT